VTHLTTLIALGDDPESDESMTVRTDDTGNVWVSLPDGWDGAWFTHREARRLHAFLDAYLRLEEASDR
jgi:hypothetical protein